MAKHRKLKEVKNFFPNRVVLSFIEGTLLGFLGLDRLYMGFPLLAFLKLALLIVGLLAASFSGIAGIIILIPWLLFSLVDYVWVVSFSISGTDRMPFYRASKSMYWIQDGCSKGCHSHLYSGAREWARGIAFVLLVVPCLIFYYVWTNPTGFLKLPETVDEEMTDSDKEFLSTNPGKGDILLISFANNCCEIPEAKMADTAKKFGIQHFRYDLETSRHALPKHITQRIIDIPIGAGLWSWKPHLIMYHMKQSPEGTVIMYGDTSIRMKAPGSLIEKEIRDCGGALFFETGSPWLQLKSTIKTDVLLSAGYNPKEFWKEHGQEQCILAAFAGLVNNSKNRLLVQQWIDLMEDVSLMDTSKSVGGRDSLYMIFNGYDQSILSLLVRKHYPGTNNPAIAPAFSRFGHRLIGIDSSGRNSLKNPKYMLKYFAVTIEQQGRKLVDMSRPFKKYETVEQKIDLMK